MEMDKLRPCLSTSEMNDGGTGGTGELIPVTAAPTTVIAAPIKMGCPLCLQRWARANTPAVHVVSDSAMALPIASCRRGYSAIYTRCDVALHTTEGDCWLVAHGKVYDVTAFLSKHPGGMQSILRHAGTECSEDYDFHCCSAQKLWNEFLIGRVVPCNPSDTRSCELQ